MVIVKNSGDAKLDVERKGNVARVFLKETGQTVAWNIFEVSSMFEIAERGQVFLTDDQVARLNQELQAQDFTEKIINDKEPKFVVGEIVEMVAHPDSDHSISAKWQLRVIRQCKLLQELLMRVSV